jgi:uncharacterized membrane protein
MFGSVFNLLLVSFTIAAAVLLLLQFLKKPQPVRRADADRDHSLEILKRKFANREISEEEYIRMRTILDV